MHDKKCLAITCHHAAAFMLFLFYFLSQVLAVKRYWTCEWCRCVSSAFSNNELARYVNIAFIPRHLCKWDLTFHQTTDRKTNNAKPWMAQLAWSWVRAATHDPTLSADSVGSCVATRHLLLFVETWPDHVQRKNWQSKASTQTYRFHHQHLVMCIILSDCG